MCSEDKQARWKKKKEIAVKQTQYKGQRQRLIISHVFFLLLCNFLSASCRLVDWTAVPTMGKASFLFFNLFIFNWRIITLQYCVLFKLKVCSVVRPVASPSVEGMCGACNILSRGTRWSLGECKFEKLS